MKISDTLFRRLSLSKPEPVDMCVNCVTAMKTVICGLLVDLDELAVLDLVDPDLRVDDVAVGLEA